MVKARVVIIDAEGSDEALRAIIAAFQTAVAPTSAPVLAAPPAPLVLAPAPPAAPRAKHAKAAPRGGVRRTPASTSKAAPAAGGSVKDAVDDLRAFFNRLKAPVRANDVKAALSLNHSTFTRALKQLTDGKQVVRRGWKLGSPEVMAGLDQEGD